MPKVSIIIPTYNVEQYLRECLDSVTGQTLRDIEIICVNDGSTDHSLDIIREYAAADPRIVVLTGPNGGYGKAMNKGFDAWEAWAERTLADDFVCHTDFSDATREQYLENARQWFEEKDTKRLCFDNLLVRDNWAAIHYRTVSTVNGVKEDKSIMQFFRFREEEDGVKLVECWNK